MKPKPLPVFLILDAVDFKAVIPAHRFIPTVAKPKRRIFRLFKP